MNVRENKEKMRHILLKYGYVLYVRAVYLYIIILNIYKHMHNKLPFPYNNMCT